MNDPQEPSPDLLDDNATEHPRQTLPDGSEDPRRLSQPFDTTRLKDMSEAAMLKHYVRQVEEFRRTRGDLRFRQADLEVLVGILGTSPAAIERKLRALTGCGRRTAALIRRAMMASALVSAVAVMGPRVTAIANAARGSQPAGADSALVVAAAPNVVLRVPTAAAGGTQVPSSPAAPSGQSTPASTVNVGVAVLAYVDLQVDGSGNPVAVRTNTGDAPAPGGSWYVFGPNHPAGDLVEGTSLVNRVVAATQADRTLPAPGRWLPGTWYSLKP